ncbi:MAG TPA: type VI secretion system baseplate subunit TssG, partial [Myxococcota bacterium]|nr:type VI secretion system baseplate subunit TssG [Myxococcota bacterium]
DEAPEREVVRFTSDLSPVFPRSEVQRAEPADEAAPARLVVNFMGVATPASFGTLPRRYAEEIRALVRQRSPALRDFLDLFNHRLISLFLRARERHQPVLHFERGAAGAFERALAALLGIATPRLRARLALDDHALFARAGLLAMRPMPASALESLVSSVFAAPAELEPFRPATHRIEPDDHNRLGAANSSLGSDLFLGEEVVLVESRFRLRVGPLGLAAYEALLPDQAGHAKLVDLLRFATRGELEFEIQLLLAREEAPALQLGAAGAARGRLGWSSWLAPAPGPGPALGDALFSPAEAAWFPREAAA